MKILVIISLLASVIFTQETTSYSWEDGTGTILGSYGNLADPANVGTTSGISPSDGTRMLTVSESPNGGTPQAFIAWVTNLSSNQDITACFYGYDSTPDTAPSLRIWGSWTDNDDVSGYGGSADGNTAYTDGSGWGQVCHTFSTNQENWNSGEALVIQARLYSTTQNPTIYFIDLVSVTAPNSAIVIYPGGDITGCMDSEAYNYNPNATIPCNGCCVYYAEVSISQARSAGEGTPVIIQGIVTSPNFNLDYLQHTMQDATAGIILFGFDLTDLNLSIGNEIRAKGVTAEYNGAYEIIVDHINDVEMLGNGTIPEPQIITVNDLWTNGESYESELIKIENVSPIGGDSWPTEGNFANITITDDEGSSITTLRIDDDTDIDGSLEPGWPTNVTGVGGQYDYTEPYNEYYQILPRFTTDFEGEPGMPVAIANAYAIVEVGENVTLDGSASYDDGDGSIIEFEWQQTGGLQTPVFLENEATAIATFTAPSSDTDLQFTLTVIDNDFNVDTYVIEILVRIPISIYDIQFTNSNSGDCYDSPQKGNAVITTGFVSAIFPPEDEDTHFPRFFIQQQTVSTDGWNGIYVHDTSISPLLGDQIMIYAYVNEYFGFSQLIDVERHSIISSGQVTAYPNYTGVLGMGCSLSGEILEGMLVEINNATFEGVDEYGTWTVNDGTGSTLVDDYFFDGNWDEYELEIGEIFVSIRGVVEYSYGEFKILPRVPDDFEACPIDAVLGDLSGDLNLNVLDIVILANCILEGNCDNVGGNCAGDINDDGNYNILDIVVLANCILDPNCGPGSSRIDDASHSRLIMQNNMVSIEADGFIGGVQMTLQHDNDFIIEMTDRALLADYLTNGNQTRLLVITPETEELFSYSGDFEITEIIVANSHDKISVDLLITSEISLSDAYPNPFNPVTTMDLTVQNAGNISVEVYNLKGQVISTLLRGYQSADTYTLTWDASHAPSGVYFVKVQADGFATTQKLMLIK